jgi:hypothetical protein
MRARAQMRSRAAISKITSEVRNPPPRNSAVSGGLIVQENSVSVRSGRK